MIYSVLDVHDNIVYDFVNHRSKDELNSWLVRSASCKSPSQLLRNIAHFGPDCFKIYDESERHKLPVVVQAIDREVKKEKKKRKK